MTRGTASRQNREAVATASARAAGPPVRLSSRTAFTTPWFSIVAKLQDGHGEPYYALSTLDYVSVLPLTDSGRVVLVRQFRPAVECHTLELPAGHVEPGETPVAAARRELEEETGYRAADVELLASLKPDTGRLANRMWAFVATGLSQRAARATVADGIEVVEVTPRELSRLIAGSRFDHAMQLGLLLLAIRKGRLDLDGAGADAGARAGVTRPPRRAAAALARARRTVER
jgi:ADP-ribose pyrophosphatase